MPSERTPLHCFLFMKFFVAHKGDGVFTKSEEKVIHDSAQRLAVTRGMSIWAVDTMLAEARLWYTMEFGRRSEDAMRRLFADCAEIVRMDNAGRHWVLAELFYELARVAHADRMLEAGERRILDGLQAQWAIPNQELHDVELRATRDPESIL